MCDRGVTSFSQLSQTRSDLATVLFLTCCGEAAGGSLSVSHFDRSRVHGTRCLQLALHLLVGGGGFYEVVTSYSGMFQHREWEVLS